MPRVLFVVLLLALVVWLAEAPLLTLPGAYLVHEDDPRKADAIVVLGGDEFGQRIVKGAELERAGFAPIVIVSGPPVLTGHESDLMIQFAESKGFPAAYFRSLPLNSGVNSTRSEARIIGQYLKTQGFHRILVVTSNYHTRRSGDLWRKEAPFLDVYVVAAPDRFFTPSTWWLSRQGKKTFLYEWMKTVATWLGA